MDSTGFGVALVLISLAALGIGLFRPIAAHSSIPDNYAIYESQIKKVHEDYDSIYRTGGYPEIIKRYEAILQAFPDYDRNLELEVEIAKLKGGYELPEEEEEAKRRKFKHYLYIIDKYSDAEPMIRLVKRDAAFCIADLDRAESDRRLKELLEEYPTDDALRLESYFFLGNNALIDHRYEDAEEYFAVGLLYDAGGLPLSDDDTVRVIRARDNAAAGILSLLKSGEGPPEVRLQRFDEGLKKYPMVTSQLFLYESAARFRQELEDEIRAELEEHLEGILEEIQKGEVNGVDTEVPSGHADMGESNSSNTKHILDAEATEPTPKDAGSASGIRWVSLVAILLLIAGVWFFGFRRNS